MVITTRYVLVTLLFLLIGLLSPNLINAQSSLGYQWYLNANVGLAQLYGDVQNEDNHFSKLQDETELGYGLRLGKFISPIFSGHTQFMMGKFKGQKDKDDLKFSTDAMEAHLGATINLTNLIFGKKERTLNVYGLAGAGAVFFRSEARRISSNNLVNDFGYSKDDERNKTSREMALVFPMGAGLDIKLADRWYMNLETVLRLSDSDKLDAIESGGHNDAYYYTSLGLSFNFGKRLKKEPEIVPDEIAETPADPFAGETVDLNYDIPNDLQSYDHFLMKCTITKGKIDGPAELTQILPIGFVVTDSVIDNARVEFKNYTLHLYWDELPSDSVFEISYHVQLNNIYGNLPLNSILYLDRTGQQYKFKTEVFIERKPPSELVVTEPLPEQEEMEEMPEEKKVEFRVQVRAAYKAEIPLQQLANKYHLRDEIQEDYVGNWYRYSIGSFENYEDAKEYRKTIVGEHGVRDAFIVAFYEGERLNDLSELKDLAPEAYPFKTKYEEDGICYRVQILALMKKEIDPNALKDIYSIEEEVHEEVYHNWRKYTVGKCTSKENANDLRKKMIEKGIVDAFIVIYKNGERITFNGHLN
jgi:hypothetical protein